ncbi:MAG: hypothetical protein QNK36_08035 [Colwellia sp.]|nr:hypothetical protein [Colwellia sp.]
MQFGGTGSRYFPVRKAVENYYGLERKVELCEAQVDSMQSEIDRLRLLIDINK